MILKSFRHRVVFAALVCIGLTGQVAAAGMFSLLGSYDTRLASIADETTAGETAALRNDRMYVTNADDVSLDIVDVLNPASPVLLKRVDLSMYGGSVNSVDVSSGNLVAVAVEGHVKTDPGTIVFLTPGGKIIRTATVGALPDMVVFTSDGKKLLVANEGEPDCYNNAVEGISGCTDPLGSVSVITVVPRKQQLQVDTIDFTGVNIPAGVRVFGPNATPEQDLEPEYITVSGDGRTAWVTLQENNAVAMLDLENLEVVSIFPLGYKDHSQSGQGLDPSDRDSGINIQPWAHVMGMYQPDAIASFTMNGDTYLVTANEGDARDYDGFVEEERARDVPALAGIAGATDNAMLGRLNVTLAPPNGDTGNLYAFGARSFSIWNSSSGVLVWDSGDDIEQRTAAVYPAYFNANNDNNSFESRSDNKGPEPEGVAVGTIGEATYAFIGLERIGGVMVYDVSDPVSPGFVQYLNNRDYTADPVGPDSGPEVIRFIESGDSPTGKPLVVVANEITGTVSLYAPTVP